MTILSRLDISSRPELPPMAFGIIRRDLDERTSVIAVEGELDLATAPRLKWALIDAIDEGRRRLVLDLSHTSFMDSTALGVLVAFNRGLDADARLAIACAQAKVLTIFELSGMDGAFPIFHTLEEALAQVGGNAA
jgi:anti-sigma B factor antagonist